jgi:phosphatidylinositol 4-kinase
MATFKVTSRDNPLEEPKWQPTIFKVGDDCRQDVLALQVISLMSKIFEELKLPLFVFAYRVVATDAGCGVIEVIPRAISRDQMGREKINDLYDYFIFKFGPEKRKEFEEARMNFIKSVAAYSIICYLLAIKDRHNGNIMLDDKGRIIHIDFGFILDISPGGINFESSPFKLTTEMIKILGGNPNCETFKVFEDACIKAFLAAR